MDRAAAYIHAGFVIISIPNLALIASMVLLFVVALLAPFPGHGGRGGPRG